jgi:insertion element IS1 protein InsB
VVKNGYIHNGKPKFACKACRRQFVENPAWQPISAETKAFIDKLLLERISLRGIVRVTGVSLQWLQDYVNEKYKAQPQVTDVPAQKNVS